MYCAMNPTVIPEVVPWELGFTGFMCVFWRYFLAAESQYSVHNVAVIKMSSMK